MRFKRIILISSILAVLALIIAYRTSPGLFTPGARGSFEYVRRGERLLDKAKYREAIAEFEKAFEESPQNRDIASYLIWAYSKYALTLADSADYGSAIGYLRKAYSTRRDKDTARNLAVAYSKKALADARKDDWFAAMEACDSAREYASDFAGASKDLGISLFNDALGEYREGREKTALLFLRESLLAYEDSRVYEFIGDIYYKRTELESALFYWGEAKALSPENSKLDEKIEKITKEMALDLAGEKKRLPYFDIRYEKDLSVQVKTVNRMLESAYFEVGHDLAYFPASKTVIFLYSEKNFKAIFKLPAVIGAFYDGNIRMPFPEKMLDEKSLKHHIYHEYAHAVISAKTNNNSPVWFAEGVAMREEYKNEDFFIKGLLLKIGPPGELSLASLNDAFKAGVGKRDLRPHYLLSYTVVKYIIDKWGMDGLRALLKRLAGGQHVINAIDDEFLLSEKEFNKRWGEYARKNYLLK